jgi:hypothetical protein
MYLMDFLGMLGVPLVPVHEFPAEAPVIFLPAQAAADPKLHEHVERARARGAHIIVTTSLLLTWPQSAELAAVLGVDPDIESDPEHTFCLGGTIDTPIDLEAPIPVKPGSDDIICTDGLKGQLFMRRTPTGDGSVTLLNTHTYSQADFDAVGEVLLCPRPLGLLSLGGPALAAVRAAFNGGAAPVLEGPASVTYHPFAEAAAGACVLQNFNDEAVDVSLVLPADRIRLADRFGGAPIPCRAERAGDAVRLTFTIPARGRVWVGPEWDVATR